MLEHVKASELHSQWTEQLEPNPDKTLAVRIEADGAEQASEAATSRTSDEGD